MYNSLSGHATITNYLLNYFPGLDLERRNIFGFTALMKAAMQGRTECVRALMLAGKPSCAAYSLGLRPRPLTDTVAVRNRLLLLLLLSCTVSSFEFYLKASKGIYGSDSRMLS